MTDTSAKPAADGQEPQAAEPGVAERPDAGDNKEAPADELAAARAEAEEHRSQTLRLAAELDNQRKRAARELENARKFGIERFAAELLAVLDSLEKAVETGADASPDALREGTEATLRLLEAAMQKFGVQEIDPLGEPFDPEFHEAMTTQPSAEAEPGSVLAVIQKGYSLNGRLLRPARVVVAAEPQGA